MSSDLNNTANNELGFTVFLDDGKKLEFPPLVNSKYPIPISERALREYIARGGEVLEISVNTNKQLVNVNVNKKDENTKE